MPAGPAPTVLVVDDDASLRKMLQAMLRLAGFTPLVAADARSARALLAGPPPVVPAVALLDGRLPGESGVDLAASLVAEPATAHVPLCFLTGSVHGPSRLDAGVAALPKPCSMSDLTETLNALLAAPPADLPARRSALEALRTRLLI